MTIISWKFDGNDEEMSIKDERGHVVLSDGQITIMIPQQKMVAYLNWIIHQELKHG